MNPADRMYLSLKGLSVGDAFGETFFGDPDIIQRRLANRELAPTPWPYTDDTEMALSIVDVLRTQGRIDPDRLAEGFTQRCDPRRSYGYGAQLLLAKLQAGEDWRKEAPAMFGGTGSFGNGAAMRIAPLGAYFADDPAAVCENAALAARPTHAHPEGLAGASAVAVAAALAWQAGEGEKLVPSAFLESIAGHVPESEVQAGILAAAEQPFDIAPSRVAGLLGSGYRVSAQDTVPFALWCAARHLDEYEEALWATAGGLGDVDTTCAMVGGIVALADRKKGIPRAWLEAREPLPPGFQ